jgi:pyruvate formate lyase activating enzyme
VDVCEQGAVVKDQNIQINRSQCNLCGECVEICSPGALTILGKEMEVEEVLKVVKKDKVFYEKSGGGVTVSGGEPLQQSSFVYNLFKRCKVSGICTCLDSCGYGNTEALEEILTVTDWVLFDIKHLSSRIHKKFTGKSNEIILQNAKVVASSGTPMVCRIPLIPGFNDTSENIRKMSEFLGELGGHVPMEMLHVSGGAEIRQR